MVNESVSKCLKFRLMTASVRVAFDAMLLMWVVKLSLLSNVIPRSFSVVVWVIGFESSVYGLQGFRCPRCIVLHLLVLKCNCQVFVHSCFLLMSVCMVGFCVLVNVAYVLVSSAKRSVGDVEMSERSLM